MAALSTAFSPLAAAQGTFDDFLRELRAEARRQGVSEATLDKALTGLRPNPKIVELDRRQPEFTQTFWGYFDKRLTKERIKRGRQLLVKHRRLLARVYRGYGVPPHYLVAFWGLESNFGDYKGRFGVVEALATLAYDPRRSKFFRVQLIDALRILEQGHIAPDKMLGSWAGAMGHMQFIPSTFKSYAVDFDGDGRRDIWTNLPDAFGSAANYLSRIGWRKEETWGREVRLPKGFDLELAGLGTRRAVSDWARLGIRRSDGKRLPVSQITGSIVLPAGHRGPAFLVYENFRTIMKWNRSVLYALAVGHLADRLKGRSRLLSEPDSSDRPLSRAEVEEIQSRLNTLGFDVGKPDGVAGPLTRRAVRAYQRGAGLPPDGYPSADLLQQLRQASIEPGGDKKEGVN
ncbi:MAG: lytic murein transglycosylase [Kiloniellales bacterium]|nr:lytic murein transglycosylase [Kiloniellales bacterium]